MLATIAVNLLSGANRVASIDWMPLLFALLGLLVVLRIRIAEILVRVVGSCVLILLVITIGSTLFDVGNEVTYRNWTLSNPTFWQTVLLLLCIGGMFLPPWWALQRDERYDRQRKSRRWMR